MAGNHGGARPGAGRTQVRRKLSKAAAKRLAAEWDWATADVQDEILSTLILHAPPDMFAAAAAAFHELAAHADPPIIL